MKSTRSILAIACCALLVFSLTSALAETGAPVIARFSPDDLAVSYVYAGATKDEAKETFGEPADMEFVEIGATGETQEIWYFDGLTLTFSEENTLVGAEAGSGAYPGPRGIAAGQTLEDVTGRFFRDPGLISTDVLYTSGYVEDLEAQFPPCGYIQREEDGTVSVFYVAPVSSFGDDVLSDPMDFIYEPLATLAVHFGPDGTVADYAWYLRPWAE